MNTSDITAFLPHRAPMLLVDQVVELVDGRSLVALKTIPLARPGHYAGLPGNPPAETCEYPAALLLESWCQAAGILATWRTPSPDVTRGQVMLLTSMSEVRRRGRAWPGEVVEHRVRLLKALDDAVVFEGESFGGDGRCLQTMERVVMTMRPAAALARPAAERKEMCE